MTLLVFILLSFVTYRTGRFVALDTLIDEPRDKVAWWLKSRDAVWADKALELMSCPWCITIWTGFFATLFWSLVLHEWPGWWFLVYWPAVSTGGVLTWTIIDSD